MEYILSTIGSLNQISGMGFRSFCCSLTPDLHRRQGESPPEWISWLDYGFYGVYVPLNCS